MKNKLVLLPNMITGLNILCGFWAILFIISGKYISAAWLIILAGLFDLLDGKIARLVGSCSNYGIELDSMADVISFGIAPAVLFYAVCAENSKPLIWIVPFLYLIMGISRLIRYNIMSQQKSNLLKKDNFTGLPIPTAAFAVASYVLFVYDSYGNLSHINFYLIIILLVSFLMVSPIEFQAFPKLGFSNRGQLILTLAIFISLGFIAYHPSQNFFIITMIYVFFYPLRLLFNSVLSTFRTKE